MKINTSSDHFLIKKSDFKDLFNIMKICLFLLFAFAFQLMATNTNAQDAIIELRSNSVTVSQLISEIEKQTDYLVVYSNREVNTSRTVSLKNKSDKVSEYLNQTFSGTDIGYDFEKNYIVLSKKAQQTASTITNLVQTLQQQGKTVRGTVTDSNGEPVIGATIVVQGDATKGTVTDIDGNFILSNLPENAVLQITYVGMKPQEISTAGRSTIDVIMEADMELLEELVVVGYGVQKKVSVSGSVSSISTKDITKSSTSNLSNALVGRLPGLIGINESGKPGSGSRLYIRGMGTWNDSNPLMIVDGVERDFTTMDPNDVESITILKDAAAAAVYGARAANGVILVTSKRGTEGKPKVTLNAHYGVKDYTRYPELATPYEWGITRNQAYLMDGVSKDDPRIFPEDQLNRYKSGEEGTDWFRETFSNNASQIYANLNVSGGNERAKYFVSVGHHNEDALIDNFRYKKFNIRSNVDLAVSDRLNISLDIDAKTTSYDTPGWSVEYLFEMTPRQNPTYNSYHPNGLPVNTTGEHLLEMVHNSGGNEQTSNNFNTIFKADYKLPLDGLTARGMFSYGKRYNFNKSFFIPYTMYDVNDNGDITNSKVVGEKSKLDESFSQGYGYTYTLSLNYNKTFNEHDVGALLLYEEETSNGNWFSAYRTNFVSDAVPQFNAGGDLEKSNNGSANEWARNGLVGRVNYAYKGTYMLETSFRYDGSITFPKESRYGFFPSISAAWRISEESFIKDNYSFVDNLKLRASYGTLGNDRVALWQYMSDFGFSNVATIGGNNISSIAVYNNLVPNPNITWEKSSTLNFGLEGMLWQGLLSGEIDWFYKKTTDILAPQIRTIPSTFGANLPDVNYGILENKGIEVSLNHANKISDFSYSIGGNFSFVRNKVIKFDESETTPEYYKVVGKPFSHVSNKRPYYGLVGMKAIGIFQTKEEISSSPVQFNGGQKPGDVKYADVNNDGVVNEYDLAVVSPYGSIPEIVYGMNMSAGWKNFELSALFQGVANKSIMLDRYGNTMFLDGTSNYFKYLTEDAWSPENTNASFPRPHVGLNTNNHRASSVWVMNASYLRLKNIELSYTFSDLNRLNGLRLYVNGNNLLTFDSLAGIMDPESPSGAAQYYPQMKSVNFGINLTF
jgi:TonB-linked SusC/RagA family outer membrane protein